MIKEFSFGNYRSFKEIQSLNMTASKINELNENNIIVLNEKQSLLKSKAIYGANASGKSNIVKALVSFIKIIKNSVKDEKVLDLIENFKLSVDTDNKPSFFQLIFEINKIQFRYGFEVTDKEIKSEWLFGVPNEREVCYFVRENNTINDISKLHFEEGHKLLSIYNDSEGENEVFRSNSLFLSAVAAMNGKLSKQIVNSIFSITVLSGLQDKQLYNISGTNLRNEETKNKITEFLKIADVGINSLDVIDANNTVENDLVKDAPVEYLKKLEHDNKIGSVISMHDKFNSKKEKVGEANLQFLSSQSEGTLKMFEISSFIIKAIENGETLVIDEFDARLHPLISKKIVELFNSQGNSSAQLIFITHDTNLLSADLLRRDQIDFVEKDKYGESHLYSLVQFKGIRNSASFEKDYIKGKYGAIPFLGDFNQLFNTEKDA
ncbi:MAG: ATP-binding protein [Paludibacter sp.]